MDLYYEIDDTVSPLRSIWSKELAELYFHQGCFVQEVKLVTIYHDESAVRTTVTTPITDESYFE